MPGVKAVDANPIAQKTTVTFDDSKVKVEDIVRTIRNQRYEVLGEPTYIK
jgi:copper chaperone CopZ